MSRPTKVRLSDVRAWLAHLVTLKRVPRDAVSIVDRLHAWDGARPSGTTPIAPRRDTGHSDPTASQAVGRFERDHHGRLQRVGEDVGSAVSRLVAGVATIRHGIEIVKDAIEELRPMTPEQARALAEAEHRAAGRCIHGCDLEEHERLKKDLCPMHYKREWRAEKHGGDKQP